MLVNVKRLTNLDGLSLPQYAKNGDSARDLYAAINENIYLEPFDVIKVPTGIALDLGPGMEAQVRPRSGLSSRGVLVHFGTVDESYTGEICVIVHNLSKQTFVIGRGDRIAQLVIASNVHYEWNQVNEVRETSRGSNGFGHTGK